MTVPPVGAWKVTGKQRSDMISEFGPKVSREAKERFSEKLCIPTFRNGVEGLIPMVTRAHYSGWRETGNHDAENWGGIGSQDSNKSGAVTIDWTHFSQKVANDSHEVNTPGPNMFQIV